jgi:hypothetical protein
MNELLESVLNDVTARDDGNMAALASDMAEKFAPWADVAEM